MTPVLHAVKSQTIAPHQPVHHPTHTAIPTLPVTEQDLNSTLPEFYQDIADIKSLTIRLCEGYFSVRVQAKKLVKADTTISFKIIETHLSASEQYIRLQPLEHSLFGRTALASKIGLIIANALFNSLMKMDTIQVAVYKQSSVTVANGIYTIHVGNPSVHHWLADKPKIEQALRLAPIKEIRCVEGAFLAIPTLALKVSRHATVANQAESEETRRVKNLRIRITISRKQ